MEDTSYQMIRDQHLIRSVWPEWDLMVHLGSGQFGNVYKARKHGFAGDSFAAVKIITIEIGNNESGFNTEQTDSYLASVAQNYAREIKMMESVKGYSNIVNIEDYSVIKNSGGKPWYVLIRMELLTPLFAYLENRKTTDETIVRIGSDLCRALEVCASRKIVHRDIKPANVCVNNDNVFKLGDFGVARQILENTFQTRTGSPDFMAPEVYNGNIQAASFEQAQKADIYSLGMLLYWAANEKRMPFMKQKGLITQDEKAQAFERKMSGEKLPDPVNASDPLKKIILKACAYKPSERYETAEQLREALEKVRTGIPPVLPSRRKLITVISAVAAVCLLAGVYLAFRKVSPPSLPSPSLAPVLTPTSLLQGDIVPAAIDSVPSAATEPGPESTSEPTPGPTPTRAPVPVRAMLADDLAAWSGPSTAYTGCGNYQMKGEIVTVYSRKADSSGVLWAEIEFSYGGEYRRVWTGARRLKLSDNQLAGVPEEDNSILGEGRITTEVIPRYGPGTMYSAYSKIRFYRGDQVTVIREENGFYLTECFDSNGETFRSWISVEDVSLN